MKSPAVVRGTLFVLVAALGACPKPPPPSDPGGTAPGGTGGGTAEGTGGTATGGTATGGTQGTGGAGGEREGTGGAGTGGTATGGASALGTGGASTTPEPGMEITPPEPPMVVAAAGDIAAATDGDEKTTATLLHKIHGETPLKAILMLGDGAYRFARLDEYRRLYEPTWGVPEFKAITHPIPGNHEYLENPTAGGYFDYWNGIGQKTGPAGERGKGFYSFELGNWHVIALNSSEDCKFVGCGEGSEQMTWLRADLAAHKNFCTLGMVHNPRFQSGTHRGDTPALQPAWAAMYDAGVDLVVAAHEHNYQQFAPMDKDGKLDRARGIRSFVVGTGGGKDFREVFNNARMGTEEKRIVNQSGVLFLTLGARDYSFRWLYADGRVGASGSDVCH
jgi:hypothetical protein